MTRTQADVDFIIGDWERSGRVAREAGKEIEALRELVRDMVDACVPNLSQMPYDTWDATAWQSRARHAAAGFPLTRGKSHD